MELYFDLSSQCRCNADGIRLNTAPLLHYKEKPVWNIHFYQSGTTPADLSRIAAWRAAVDTDLSADSGVICRTPDSEIDRSLAAEGILSIPVNANTAEFAVKADGKERQSAYLEIWGLDTGGDPVLYVRMNILISGVVDPDGGPAPEEVSPDFLNTATVSAWLRAAGEFQFTGTPEDDTAWHEEQAPDDTHIRCRNSILKGEWSGPVLLARGLQGEKGDPGPQGAGGYSRCLLSSDSAASADTWYICTADLTLTLPEVTENAYIRVSAAGTASAVILSGTVDGDPAGYTIGRLHGSVELFGTADGWIVAEDNG